MGRMRSRGTTIRVQRTEARTRTISRSRRQQAPNQYNLFYFQNVKSHYFFCPRAPSFAVRQKRHKRNPAFAIALEEREDVFREPKPAPAPLCAIADNKPPYHP